MTIDAGEGFVVNEDGGGVLIDENGGGIILQDTDGGTIVVQTGAATNGGINVDADGDLTLQAGGDVSLTAGGDVITSLPTSDPSVSNAVWTDDGVLVLSGSTAGRTGIFWEDV